jgi:hypothetical protein
MTRKSISLSRFAALAILVVFVTAKCARVHHLNPIAANPAKLRPSELLQQRAVRNPPKQLTGSGEEARKSALAFIVWAGASSVDQREDVRKAIAAARDNADIVKAFADEAKRAQNADHSRALLVLSILGEMQSPQAIPFLSEFVRQPFPQTGTQVDGEIIEQTALATLQAKAIDGLAYIHRPDADEDVLRAVAGHPSRIVRAEAINAYLFNHGDSSEARATLAKYVRKGEEIFLDRPRRESGESAAPFNRKLEIYLKQHPETQPPPPAHEYKREKKGTEKKPFDKQAPPF